MWGGGCRGLFSFVYFLGALYLLYLPIIIIIFLYSRPRLTSILMSFVSLKLSFSIQYNFGMLI